MKMLGRILSYGLFGSIIFIIDRLSKINAIMMYHNRVMINQFLSFDLALNRGISWGLFYSRDTLLFVVISVIIGIVTAIIAVTGIKRFLAGHMVIGELLVVVGSLSNLIDRYYYKGVIDFIELSYNEYVWPLFNIADACIVMGIFLMVMEYYKK